MAAGGCGKWRGRKTSFTFFGGRICVIFKEGRQKRYYAYFLLYSNFMRGVEADEVLSDFIEVRCFTAVKQMQFGEIRQKFADRRS